MTDIDGHMPAPIAPTREPAPCPDARPGAAWPAGAERRRPGRAAYTNPALLALLRQDSTVETPGEPVEAPGAPTQPTGEPVDALAPARGIALATAIGTALWAAVLLALWLIWPG